MDWFFFLFRPFSLRYHNNFFFLFQYHANKIPAMKQEMRDLTEQPLNHVAYIGRTSDGTPISHEAFKKLKDFAKNWKWVSLNLT